MSLRMHRSSDGLMRPCTAKTPEACTVTGVDGKQAPHFMFDSPQAAKQWNALALVYTTIPRANRKEQAAVNLLSHMRSLQEGAPASNATAVVELQEVVSAVSSIANNKTLKKESDIGLFTDEELHVMFTDEELQAMRDAVNDSGTGSPKLDFIDITAFASKLKTGAYAREEQEDYEYVNPYATESAYADLTDSEFGLKMASIGLMSTARQKGSDEPFIEMTEAVCSAYERLTELDTTLPLNARRDLRKIARKWAEANYANAPLSYDDDYDVPAEKAKRLLDEYSIIIDGLTPVINRRPEWFTTITKQVPDWWYLKATQKQ